MCNQIKIPFHKIENYMNMVLRVLRMTTRREKNGGKKLYLETEYVIKCMFVEKNCLLNS